MKVFFFYSYFFWKKIIDVMFFMVNKNKTNQFLLDCKLVRYCNTERFRSEFRTKVFVLNVLLFLAFSLNKNGKYCGAFPTRVVMVNLFRLFGRLSWKSERERDLPDLLTFFLVKDSTWLCSLALTSLSQCVTLLLWRIIQTDTVTFWTPLARGKDGWSWYCDFFRS